jgi:hypothetical protein
MKIPLLLNGQIRITVLELMTQLMKFDEKGVWIKHAIGFCESINLGLSVQAKYEESGEPNPFGDDLEAEIYFNLQYLMLNLQTCKDRVFRTSWLGKLESFKNKVFDLSEQAEPTKTPTAPKKSKDAK